MSGPASDRGSARPANHIPHRRRVPSPAPGCPYSSGVESSGDAAQGGNPSNLDFTDDRPDVLGESVCPRLLRRHAHGAALLGRGRTQLDATRLGGLQGLPGTLADLLALPLGHDGPELQHRLVGLRHVATAELDAGFHQAGDEMDVAGQAVELGDHEDGLVVLTGSEGLGELGAACLVTGLDLDELGQKLSAVSFTVGVVEDVPGRWTVPWSVTTLKRRTRAIISSNVKSILGGNQTPHINIEFLL